MSSGGISRGCSPEGFRAAVSPGPTSCALLSKRDTILASCGRSSCTGLGSSATTPPFSGRGGGGFGVACFGLRGSALGDLLTDFADDMGWSGACDGVSNMRMATGESGTGASGGRKRSSHSRSMWSMIERNMYHRKRDLFMAVRAEAASLTRALHRA